MLGSARTREAQNWRLLQAAAIGVVAGLTLFPLFGFPIARILPFGSLPDGSRPQHWARTAGAPGLG